MNLPVQNVVSVNLPVQNVVSVNLPVQNVVSVNLPVQSRGKCQRWKRLWGRYLNSLTVLKQMIQARKLCLWNMPIIYTSSPATCCNILQQQYTRVNHTCNTCCYPNQPFFKFRSCKLEIYILHWMEVFST